jgi:diguanylate cyclase (GGDEF)-like protein
MKERHAGAFFASFRKRHSEDTARQAVSLLVFQGIFLSLLLGTAILVVCVDSGSRLLFYLALLLGLSGIIGAALFLNFKGKYKSSAWLTTVCMVLGPWFSILLDPAVVAGDFVPLVYIGISIQLCSILLSERATIGIALFQMSGLIAFILFCPALRAINWPSLVAFIAFTATIGTLAGFSNRKQLEQIEQQRNQLQRDEAKLRELSVHDPLTGLYNRRYMEETLDREIKRALRKERSLAVVMTDIDGFKAINDTFGHVPGDMLLVRVAKFLMKGVRASDVVCRYGGDEFVLILPECSLEEAILRVSEMRLDVEKMPLGEEVSVNEPLTMSFGVAALPENGTTLEELIKAADQALYASKRAGRNRVNGN